MRIGQSREDVERSDDFGPELTSTNSEEENEREFNDSVAEA